MAEGNLGRPLRRFFWSSPIFQEWSGSTALMDWLETPTAHVFKIDVPGFRKDELKVKIEENILQIRGNVDKDEFSEKEEAIWHVAERVAGNRNFYREIELPENVKVKNIKAHLENGVLTITIPKDGLKKSGKVTNIKVTSKL